MKITGAAFLVLLIAVAIVLILRVKEVEHVRDDVARMVPLLEEEGVEARTMRHRDALARINELENLCATPSLIASSVPRLRQVAEEAASWAAGSPAPSVELTASVALRAAVIALREYAVRPSARHLDKARSELLDAKSALEGFEPTTTTVDALRDRMKNIDYSRREQLQELEEAY
ncbi:MAG: hypothetical protein KAJ78_01220 [Acidobacteria bacterium]|nr:hypothetical protein [Acidobacteriota bacterium]